MNKNEWSGHSAPTGTEPTELDDDDLLAQSKYSVSPQQAKQMSFLLFLTAGLECRVTSD